MSGVITTGNWGKALWPGINAFWGKFYNEHETEYNKLFDTFKSRKNSEEDVATTTFGLAAVRGQGAPVQFASDSQSYVTRYTHIEYALGFIISRIMVEDDLYDVASEKRTRQLAFSMNQTKELVAANVYNRAFNSSYTGGDGKELCATDHPNKTGGTRSNELAVSADLSEASLEQMCIDIMKAKNDVGHQINLMPMSLIIPPDLLPEAERILKSPQRVSTSDNDINYLYASGKFPKGVVVNHYLSDADAFFVRTNVMDGMKHWVRRPMEFTMDNDFDTDNAKYKATERYSFGWSDFLAVYGSPGA